MSPAERSETHGSTRSQRQRLRETLTGIVDGTDRSHAAVERVLELVERIDDIGYAAALRFVADRYREGRLSEPDLVLMTEQVLGELRAERRPEPRWRLAVPADARGLDRRWTDAAGRERALELATRLRSREPLEPVAFGEHEGRLDLRGFVSPMPDLELLDTAKNLVLDGVDLSGARLGRIAFTQARISRSRFEGIRWSGGGLWSTTVEDASLRGSDLSEGTLGGRSGPPNAFRQVDFRGADLSGQHIGGVLFEDCDFSDARLNGTEFHADLIRCRFAGHLHGTAFYGRRKFDIRSKRLEDVDFTRADLHWAMFRGLDLAGVRLPETPGHIIVRNLPCVLDRLGRLEKEGRLPPELAFEVGGLREWRGRNQRVAVISVNDMAEHASKDELATALAILDDAQRACGPAAP